MPAKGGGCVEAPDMERVEERGENMPLRSVG